MKAALRAIGISTFIGLAGLTLAGTVESQGQSPNPSSDLAHALYKNPSAPIPARVEDLLARMTLAEKVAQLRVVWQAKTTIFDDKMQFDAAKASRVYPDGLGGLARPSDLKGPVSPRIDHLRESPRHRAVGQCHAALGDGAYAAGHSGSAP